MNLFFVQENKLQVTHSLKDAKIYMNLEKAGV